MAPTVQPEQEQLAARIRAYAIAQQVPYYCRTKAQALKWAKAMLAGEVVPAWLNAVQP